MKERFPALLMPAAERRAWVGRDCLKINYVRVRSRGAAEIDRFETMKTTEQIDTLRRIVADWDTKPLEDAEENLFGRLAEALAAYDYEKRHGQPPTERVCLLCGKLVSDSYC